jgi:hypothetical protein
VLAIVAAASAFFGCSLEKTDDASEYREALPEAANVRMPGPDSASPGSRSATAYPGSGFLADGATPARPTAEWYRFTRNVRDGVNAVTAAVLGSVWYVVHTRPTTIGEREAKWGPYTDALDPVAWRLRVQRVEEHEYYYVLEGRPRASNSEGDYLTVLSGTGYGRADERHGDGELTINLDAARELDPDRHADDSGTVTITHELPAAAGRELGALPRQISAELDPAGEPWLSITSTAALDGSGRIELSAFVDVDDSKATALEDVAIVSRFRVDGAGRADVVIAAGDVPPDAGAFSISECWGGDFQRVFYQDSIDAKPTQGDASACVYAATDTE